MRLSSRNPVLGRRLERGKSRAWLGAGLVSLVVHGTGAMVLSQIEIPEQPVPDRVLQVEFVSRGTEDGTQEPTDEVAPEPRPVPNPQPAAAVSKPAPVSPAPRPAPQPTEFLPPEIRFPALYAAAQIRPSRPVNVFATPDTFEAYQQQRTDHAVPAHLRHKGGGEVDGDDAVDNEGVDRCQPASGRTVERLYLLYDSSGSMSSHLRNQALSCAQQYARAVLDGGGEVVVGNFARSAHFQPATRNYMDVGFALRAENDARATLLPSSALNPFFDEALSARADLVILSDGVIPNYRTVLPWYRYFLDINPENRGYLYTLGTQAPRDVSSSLRKIGFEIRVYRTL